MIGIAWYRPEQWDHLRESVADPEVMEDSYEKWLTLAQQTVLDLSREGIRAERIDVDVDELVTWCRETGRTLDDGARSHFATEKLRSKHERKGSQSD